MNLRPTTSLPARLATLTTGITTGLAIAVLAAVSSAAAPAPAAAAGPSPLAATFEAHGGLDRFAAKRQLVYTMDGFPLSPGMARPNRSTVDLRERFNRIDGDGFTVGFDGNQAWAVPNTDVVGLPSRFVTLGSFYFIGMPFVFGDEGVVVTEAGTGTFRGRTYRVYDIGYRRGTGYTSTDDYKVFVDPDTDRLALIHHSVTENPDVDRVTWVFDEWQQIDGLTMPAKMTFHPSWNPDEPGAGHSFTIEDVRFSTKAPARTLFEAPADAVIDDSPAVH